MKNVVIEKSKAVNALNSRLVMVADRISELQIEQVSQNASQREKDMGSLKVRLKIKTV